MTTEQLDNAVARWVDAQPGIRRSMWTAAISIGMALHVDAELLDQKLGQQWRWLDTNAGHAKHDERERAFLETLGQYERTWDALNRAAAVLLEGKDGQSVGWWDGVRKAEIARRGSA